VTLVDDNQSEIVRGHKQAGARADNHPWLAGLCDRRAWPDEVALGFGELGVAGENEGAESGLELERLPGA